MLEDFGLHFHKRSVDGSGKCNILCPGGGVHIAVYAMSDADKVRLDEIEGVGKGYLDTVIEVPGYGESAVYVAEEGHRDDSLRPYRWYRELVLLGCSSHGFPETYVASIAAIDAIPDPDLNRSAQNEALIERIRRS